MTSKNEAAHTPIEHPNCVNVIPVACPFPWIRVDASTQEIDTGLSRQI